MFKKLKKLDGEFKTQYLAIIEAVESDELAKAEQEELDSHNDTFLLALFSEAAGLTADPPALPLTDRSLLIGAYSSSRQECHLSVLLSQNLHHTSPGRPIMLNSTVSSKGSLQIFPMMSLC